MNVGSVVFILMNKDKKIVPALIVEEISKKTISSELVVSYMVNILGTDRPQDLKTVPGIVYESLADLHQTLMTMTMKSIATLVDQAARRAREVWPEAFQVHPASPGQPSESLPSTEVGEFIDGPDGPIRVRNVTIVGQG